MAGSNPTFDAADFRREIRATMVMGLPQDPAERPTFRWNPSRTYSIDDPGGQPYSWTATPTSQAQRPDVQVPCAVQFAAHPTEDTAVGQFDRSRVLLTVLDEDHEQVKGANEVLLGGNTYAVEYILPPLGLFDATVYQWSLAAVDET